MAELRTRAILFDLDGVLVDSRECVERTWRTWATHQGLDDATVVAVAHGRRALEAIAHLAPHLDAAAEVTALAEAEASASRGVYPMRGAAALLRSLPPDRWAIVTSGLRQVAEFRIGLGDLPSPSVLIAAADVAHGKPHPEGYLLAASLLGVRPSDCVVIEDAPAGLQAATAAGMRSIGVSGTFHESAFAGASAIVSSVGALAVTVGTDGITITVPNADA